MHLLLLTLAGLSEVEKPQHGHSRDHSGSLLGVHLLRGKKKNGKVGGAFIVQVHPLRR